MYATSSRPGIVVVVVGLSIGSAFAGSHTWDVNEVFSNADGSVWFIELREANGTPNEVNVGGKIVSSDNTANMFTIASNVASPTTNRHLLFANQAFADLPGAPAPDQIVPLSSFFDVNGDTVRYSNWDTWTFGAVPTDGVDSLHRIGGSGVNSPTNYAGASGSVDASGGGPPPGMPDGSAASTPMTASRVDAAGSQLSISWDTATCTDVTDINIIFGEGSQLPSTPGGIYSLTGGACSIGTTSPFIWDSVPDAADGSRLLWWLLVAHDGSGVEGPWGKHDGVNERQGTGPNGSSQQCGVTDKDLSSSCGH